MSRLWATLAAALAILALPLVARAQSCTFSISNMNFGTVPVVSGGAVDVTATATASCTGYPATNICIGLDAGSGGSTGAQRLMTGPSSTLKYTFYQDSARTTPWGSRATPALGTIPYRTLSGASNFTYTATIYGRVFSGQSTAALGSYSSVFSGTQAEAFTLSSGTNCSAGSSAYLYASFNVLAAIASDCTMTATSLSFGSRGPLTTNTDATATITVTCTNTTPYTVGLGNGLTGTGPTARKMTSGSNSITYALYLDSARTSAWGMAAGSISSGTGSGSGQTLTVYGRVAPQTTPAAGNYSDTVAITVSY